MAATKYSKSQNTQPYDDEETQRLNEQHKYVTEGLGFLLPEVIESSLASDQKIRIADVGCGTGIWLINTVQEMSSQQMSITGSGFDISDRQFPEKADIPRTSEGEPQIQFHILDIASSDGLSAEFTGQFDVVSVRLLHITLEHDQWENTMRNLVSLLKPGGFLCWTDWDPLTARIAATKPGAKDSALREAFQRFNDVLRVRKVGNTYRIPKLMAHFGLSDIDSDMYQVPPSFGFTRNLVTGMLSLLEHTGKLDYDEGKGLKDGVNAELDAEGCLLWYDLWYHLGRLESTSNIS